jgi:hypothetical protein
VSLFPSADQFFGRQFFLYREFAVGVDPQEAWFVE